MPVLALIISIPIAFLLMRLFRDNNRLYYFDGGIAPLGCFVALIIWGIILVLIMFLFSLLEWM